MDRHQVLKQLLQKQITRKQAAQFLRLTPRQVTNLKQRVQQQGPQGLIHRLRGRPSNCRIPDAERERIRHLLQTKYPDFKPTHATEKLAERHGIARDPKTVRQIMIDAGLWQPRKQRAGSEHRAWRPRKDAYGEMEQFDGSYEYWFEDRAPKCCLLAAIDDATGRITKAQFGPHEGVVPVFGFWKQYMLTHGKPRSIYLDKFSTYQMNSAVAKHNHELLTQFQRAAKDLGIELIPANSPEAKGRVERLFETLQDRLIKELRLAKISTIPEANRFLVNTFIPWFNARFAVEPVSPTNLHRPLRATERRQLDAIFARQTARVVQNDFTLSFQNQWYQLTKQQPVTVCKKDRVIMEERLDGSVWIKLRGKYLRYTVLPERPKKVKTKQPWVLAATGSTRTPYKPPANHPWRKPLLPAQLNTSSH